jgi:hypothetical protein
MPGNKTTNACCNTITGGNTTGLRGGIIRATTTRSRATPSTTMVMVSILQAQITIKLLEMTSATTTWLLTREFTSTPVAGAM